jgi:hypothetical protein
MPTKSLTMPYHQEQIIAIYLEEELLLQQKKSLLLVRQFAPHLTFISGKEFNPHSSHLPFLQLRLDRQWQELLLCSQLERIRFRTF